MSDFRRYRHPKLGEFYLVFADTAWGGTDYCAAQFLCKDQLDVPIVYHSKTIATEMTPKIHQELERIFDLTHVKPVVCFERNNGGVAEMERLATLNRQDKYTIYQEKLGASVSPKLGWTTNSATRPTMLSMLKEAIDARILKLYDKPTISELFSFVIVQTSSSWKAQAEQGAHDDLVMSLAGAWQMYQTETPEVIHNPNLYVPEQLFDSQGFYGVS